MTLSLLSNTLNVPSEYATSLPCYIRQDLFVHEAHDYDPRDEDWLRLPAEEQEEYSAAKQVIEILCVAECNKCPILAECREWAQTAHVTGVVGGTTEAERAGTSNETLDSAVLPVTARAPRAPKTIHFDQLSDETMAIYQFLASQSALHVDRNDVVDAVAHLVDSDTALKWGQRHAGDDDEKRAAGRRRFILNRIDVASRRGGILINRSGRSATLTLPSEVYRSVTEHFNDQRKQESRR